MRLGEHGARLKREKCQFNMREAQYLGWIISAAGLKPVTEKVAAVISMRDPTNVTELRSLLGSVNYYQRLIPNLSQWVRHWEDDGPALSAQEVETATRRDSTLGRVLTYVCSGWPSVTEPEFRVFKQ